MSKKVSAVGRQLGGSPQSLLGTPNNTTSTTTNNNNNNTTASLSSSSSSSQSSSSSSRSSSPSNRATPRTSTTNTNTNNITTIPIGARSPPSKPIPAPNSSSSSSSSNNHNNHNNKLNSFFRDPRDEWKVGSDVQIYHNGKWYKATIVIVNKNNNNNNNNSGNNNNNNSNSNNNNNNNTPSNNDLFTCLLHDGKTSVRVNRWDVCIQPIDLKVEDDDDDDDDEKDKKNDGEEKKNDRFTHKSSKKYTTPGGDDDDDDGNGNGRGGRDDDESADTSPQLFIDDDDETKFFDDLLDDLSKTMERKEVTKNERAALSKNNKEDVNEMAEGMNANSHTGYDLNRKRPSKINDRKIEGGGGVVGAGGIEMKSEDQEKANRLQQQMENQMAAICGYTVWVNWCDAQELHGYYKCIGFRNEYFAFVHKQDSRAELVADNKGYWYLLYNKVILYKSTDSDENPPARRWKCEKGALPPPGVTRVALPEDGKPMIEYDSKKLKLKTEGDGFELLAKSSGVNNNKTIHAKTSTTTTTTSTAMTESSETEENPKSRKSKISKGKSYKTELFGDDPLGKSSDDMDIPMQILEFTFQGNQGVGFSVNVTSRMEVTKVKENGQAHQLGLKQGDILIRIDEEEVGKNWEKATQLLKDRVTKPGKFTITFSRRLVEKVSIFVSRAGMESLNGKYVFWKRDMENMEVPIFVKETDQTSKYLKQKTNEDEEKAAQPLSKGKDEESTETMNFLRCNDSDVHLLQRVMCNEETGESLWVLRDGKDQHFYLAMTKEYLPPQQGWDLVPNTTARYPAPGLQFYATDTKFVTKMLPDGTIYDASKRNETHDALNVHSRGRTNQHRQQQTLTKLNQFQTTSAMPMQAIGGKAGMGMGMGAGAIGRYQYSPAVKPKPTEQLPKNTVAESPIERADTEKSGLTSANENENEEDMMDRTKKAIETLKEQHDEELTKKVDQLLIEQNKVKNLSDLLFQSNESYYELWLEKCNMSLELFSKNSQFEKSKERSKQAIRRYYAQLSQNDRLLKEVKLLKQSVEVLKKQAEQSKNSFATYTGFGGSSKQLPGIGLPSASARFNGIYVPSSETPKAKELKIQMNENEKESDSDDDVEDLLKVENRFKTLVQQESMLQLNEEHSISKNLEEMQNDLSDLQSQLQAKDTEIEKLKAEVQTWTDSHESVWTMLQQKERRLYELENEEEYYKHRANNLKQTNENLENNNIKLLQLLQTVETEFVNKLNYKPTALNQRNYIQEFDPKKCDVDREDEPSTALLQMTQGAAPSNLSMSPKNDRKEKLRERLKSVNKSINGMEMIIDNHEALQNLATTNNDADESNARPNSPTTETMEQKDGENNSNELQKPSEDWKKNRNLRQGKKFMQL